MTDSEPATQPMSPQDYQFQLAKMRIENSAAYVGKMIWLITFIAGAISVIVVVSVVAISLLGVWRGLVFGEDLKPKCRKYCQTGAELFLVSILDSS
jgi:hypothetical protein